MFKKVLGKTAILFGIMMILCGLIYTLVITGIAQLLFGDKVNGSVIEIDGVKYGSELIGQKYVDETHLWGRIVLPDVSTYTNEDGETLLYAGASNKSPASEEFQETVAKRVDMIKKANPDTAMSAIPVELVTCSGSGLDPHISPAAAEYQVPRIAEANNMSEEAVREVIKKHTQGRFLGVLGEETVNVLGVNLELEGIM